MINPQRFAVAAVLSFSAVYASERIVWFAGLGSAGAATHRAADVVDRLAPQLAANVASTKTLPVATPALTVSMLSHPPLAADPSHPWRRRCVRETSVRR